MRSLLFFYIAFLLFSLDLHSQNLENNSPKLKNIKLNFIYTVPNKDTNSIILMYAPNFTMTNKRGNRHQFELNKLILRNYKSYNDEYNDTVVKGVLKERNISIRYEYDAVFLKKNKKIHPFLGLTISQTINKTLFKSLAYFDIRNLIYSTRIGIVPGVFFSLNKNITLDLSFPVNFFEYSYYTKRIFNPYIPKRDQKMGQGDMEIILENPFSIFLGIGVKI